MTITDSPAVGAVRDWRKELQERWVLARPATRLRVQISVLVVTTVAAYHYSLQSLLQTINYDTPLADVGLVPLIAGGLAFALRQPRRADPPIQDRQLDYIIGVPLISIALCINEFLPRQESVLFWVRRMDLISLPLFVAGAVTLIFGTRILWRQKFAIGYLFLAWPWPYTTILLGSLNGFTNVTVSALTAILRVVHLGAPVHSADGEAGLFSIVHQGHTFPVSVVTACSGVDGVVGFFLVGTAFAAVARGSLARKVLWLVTGLVLLWATNLLRLLFIFWAGREWGEQIAINILHPFAGLVIFTIGVAFMMLLLRPYGLSIGAARSGPTRSPDRPDVPKDRPIQPIFAAGGLIAVVGFLLAVNNTALQSYDPVANASGEPRLASFLADPASPPGWSSEYTAEFTQNKSLFGESSRWFRYTYVHHGGGNLSASLPVTADVINASGVSGFGAYGVEACYNFHGYTLKDVARVSLGDGINGESLSYSTQGNGDWSIVYWIWPVKTGTQTRYERIILYLLNTANTTVTPPAHVPGITGLSGALSDHSAADQRLIVNRAFLTAFAREIVKGQAAISESSTTDIGQILPPDNASAARVVPVKPPVSTKVPSWLSKLRQAQAQYNKTHPH